MKVISLIAVIATSFSVSSAIAVCDSRTVISNVEAYSFKVGNGYGTRFSTAKIEGILKPGEQINIQVSVDEFNVKNNRTQDILVASLYGSDLIGASFWIAQMDAKTCNVISANEVLGEGGAGL